MTKASKIIWLIVGLAFMNLLIGLIDIGANFISLIPGIGDIAETMSETLLETTQVIVNIIGMTLVAAVKN